MVLRVAADASGASRCTGSPCDVEGGGEGAAEQAAFSAALASVLDAAAPSGTAEGPSYVLSVHLLPRVVSLRAWPEATAEGGALQLPRNMQAHDAGTFTERIAQACMHEGGPGAGMGRP